MDSIKRELYEKHGEHGNLLSKSYTPEWRQIGLGIGKAITGIIGSIRKLTTDYFDIYGRDVKKGTLDLDYVIEAGGSMSDGAQAVIDSEPDDIMKISDP